MKLTPQSTAARSASNDSASSTLPHAPPMAHAPKLISETFQGVLPSWRYFIGEIPVSPNQARVLRLLDLGTKAGFAKEFEAPSNALRGISTARGPRNIGG